MKSKYISAKGEMVGDWGEGAGSVGEVVCVWGRETDKDRK